uniref:L51_S25_CI-B8 domain-containing protein n=1 Tax=Rhabditophanes sp. KR3021 TaxID=114890 RepID=A0AC35TZ99_9BILA
MPLLITHKTRLVTLFITHKSAPQAIKEFKKEYPNATPASANTVRASIQILYQPALFLRVKNHGHQQRGYIKGVVFTTRLRDIDELKDRIKDAFTKVTPQMIQNVLIEYQYRLTKLLEIDGGHVEVLNNFL